MTTPVSKFWFAVAGLALVALVAYNVASSGEWFGSFVLGTVVVVAGMLGAMAAALGDDDLDVAPAATELPVRRSLPAGWPALAAVGAGVSIVGLAGRNALLYVGFAVIGIVFVEWLVQAWAERATADPVYNQGLRHRVMSPVEVPLLGLLVIAVILISLSRVFLALPEAGATVAAGVLASMILLVAAALAARPKVNSSVFAGILAAGALAVIIGGIAGGVAGEHQVDKHEVDSGAKTDSASTPQSGGTSQSGAGGNSTPASTTP